MVGEKFCLVYFGWWELSHTIKPGYFITQGKMCDVLVVLHTGMPSLVYPKCAFRLLTFCLYSRGVFVSLKLCSCPDTLNYFNWKSSLRDFTFVSLCYCVLWVQSCKINKHVLVALINLIYSFNCELENSVTE